MIKRKGGSTSLSLFLCSIISLLLSSLFPSVTHFTFFSFYFSSLYFFTPFLCYFFLDHPQKVKQFCKKCKKKEKEGERKRNYNRRRKRQKKTQKLRSKRKK